MTPLLIFAGVAAIGLLYVVLPIVADVFGRYRERKVVRCPETGLVVDVQIDARHAAATAVPGPPELRVRECTLWPERAGCGEHCTAEL